MWGCRGLGNLRGERSARLETIGASAGLAKRPHVRRSVIAGTMLNLRALHLRTLRVGAVVRVGVFGLMNLSYLIKVSLLENRACSCIVRLARSR